MSSTKVILTAVVTTEVLNRFKPIEMLPVVGAYAGEIQLVLGSALAIGIVVKKWESEIGQGVAIGMLTSGVSKTLDKYFPKLSA